MIVLIAIMVTCMSVPLAAQQIEWSPSLRRPYEAPRTFVGIDASIGTAWHDAELPYLESIYSIPCCTYREGASKPLAVGFSAETWILPTVAATASLGLRMESTSFTTSPAVLVRNGKPDVLTQYQLDAAVTSVTLGVGAKTRIASMPITVGLSLAGSVLLASEMIHREVVLGPDDFFFVTDPPSKEYVLPTYSLSDVAGFVMRPMLTVTYDIPLTLGYYLAPSIRCETLLGSMSQKNSWGAIGVSVGATLYKGL